MLSAEMLKSPFPLECSPDLCVLLYFKFPLEHLELGVGNSSTADVHSELSPDFSYANF